MSWFYGKFEITVSKIGQVSVGKPFSKRMAQILKKSEAYIFGLDGVSDNYRTSMVYPFPTQKTPSKAHLGIFTVQQFKRNNQK